MVEKVCKVCQESKPIEEFHKNVEYADGHIKICRVCVCARNRKNYWLAIEKQREYHRKHYHLAKQRKKILAGTG